jgi:methionyl-tRNA formyltransferase
MSAQQIHDLVRAVSHPYPGASTNTSQGKLVFWRTMVMSNGQASPPHKEPCLWKQDGLLFAVACDGIALRIISMELDGRELSSNPSSGLLKFPIMLV